MGIRQTTIAMQRDQGLVVINIVSLSTPLRRRLVKYVPITSSNTLLFLLEKCANLLQCKRISNFKQNKVTVYAISLNFKF